MTLLFDNAQGGGITMLTDSSHGLSHGQGNQIGSGQNLYFMHYDGQESKINGTWSVQSQTSFSAKILQSGTLSSVPYTIEHAVHGSGKMFVRTTLNNTASAVNAKTVRQVISRRAAATMTALCNNATANAASYVLLSCDSSSQKDILMSTNNLWNTAGGIPNSATGFYTNAALGYTGYKCTNVAIGASQKQSWEYMIDFLHALWNDTTGMGSRTNDYRATDSLEFICGTRGMEKTWQHHCWGHWQFDETSGDTARDYSTNNRHTYTTGTFTTSGKRGNALQLNGSQSVTLPNPAALSGNLQFTAMLWIKTASFGSAVTAIGKHNGTNGWKITGNGSGQVTLTLNETSLYGVTNVADNNWHHITANYYSFDGTVMIFVDGNLDAYYKGAYTVTTNAANFVIGSGLTGTVDDARYYDEWVSESSIKSKRRREIGGMALIFKAP